MCPSVDFELSNEVSIALNSDAERAVVKVSPRTS